MSVSTPAQMERKPFSRHAVTLFDEHGKLAFDQDTLRVAVRSVLIDVLSCRRGMSNSGSVSRIAGVAIYADEYLPNMGSEDFPLRLSRQALEASCAEVSLHLRPKVRETRAALVEHLASEHFAHASARFAPPADELLDWIRAGSATDTIGTASHDDDGGGQAGDPAEDQDGQIEEEADRGDPENYYAPPARVVDPIVRIVSADRFFCNTGAVIRRGGNQAYYSPVMDYIQMPPFEAFRDAAVLSHEATHWTAAAHRVGRDLSRYAKDRTERAREELIAELGSCFLCADLGIASELEPRPDHASYPQSWLTVLANDKQAIFQAAAHAQRAVSFLRSLQPETDMKAAA